MNNNNIRTSCLANSSSIGSSKNLLILTSSDNPLRRRVFIINSLAKCGAGCGSNGLITIDLSNGSPGTIYQNKGGVFRKCTHDKYYNVKMYTCQ
ncbi:hypothetical protein DERP_008583 [Dermatophagoides pteronyssinus]|uniref:Uncharacterized protein n=1 Tax=Dermatophagoides pteronyssinus TaxID=6956 RepID=A0ABQ8IWQ3_DERPT|nr:hypothetical protein DERP_008583 [Dermatophagoides pteronyssinus]